MVKPTNLKEWDFVKNQKHDIVCLLEKNLNPNDYYYQCDNGVYTPVVSKFEWELQFN